MIRSGLIIAAALLLVSAFPLGAAEEAPSPSYPDPRRFEEDILAFEAADQIVAPPSGAVLCIGSSSMRFWHGTMAHDLEPLTLIPRGFGGSTMLDVLFYSSRVVVPYTPRAILLYEGDNDMDFGISPARFLATFQQFREVVRATLPETRSSSAQVSLVSESATASLSGKRSAFFFKISAMLSRSQTPRAM